MSVFNSVQPNFWGISLSLCDYNTRIQHSKRMWALEILLIACVLIATSVEQLTSPSGEGATECDYHTPHFEGEARTSIEVLNLALNNLTTRTFALEDQKYAEKETLRLVQEQNSALKGQIASSKREFSEWTRNRSLQDERQNSEMNSLKERMNRCELSQVQNRTQMIERNREIELLKSSLGVLQSQHAALQVQFGTMMQDIQMIRMNETRLQALHQEVTNLKLQAEQSRAQSLEQKLENRNLRDEIKTLKDAQTSQRNLSERLKQEVNGLVTQNQRMRADIESLNSLENSNRVENLKLGRGITWLNSSMDVTRQRIDSLNTKGMFYTV